MERGKYYSQEINDLGKQLEKIRLEIYNDTIHDLDEEFFNYVNDTLTTISNRLTFDIPQSIEVLDYK